MDLTSSFRWASKATMPSHSSLCRSRAIGSDIWTALARFEHEMKWMFLSWAFSFQERPAKSRYHTSNLFHFRVRFPRMSSVYSISGSSTTGRPCEASFKGCSHEMCDHSFWVLRVCLMYLETQHNKVQQRLKLSHTYLISDSFHSTHLCVFHNRTSLWDFCWSQQLACEHSLTSIPFNHSPVVWWQTGINADGWHHLDSSHGHQCTCGLL